MDCGLARIQSPKKASNYGRMNITVIGASRATAAQTVHLALGRGDRVTALARTVPDYAPTTGLRVVRGDALDADSVRSALQGAEAVVVTLGAPMRDKSGLRARATAVVVQEMRALRLRRLVVQSSLGVGDSLEQVPWFTKRVLARVLLDRAFADHRHQEDLHQEDLVRESGLDWTLIRPTNLKNGAGGYVVRGQGSRIGGFVSRRAVAELLLTAARDPEAIGQSLATGGTR